MVGFTYYEGHSWQNQNNGESMPSSAPTISADNLKEMEDAIKNALPMTGGEMKGELLLKGLPEEAMSAVPKEYADTNIMYIYETYSQTGTYTKKIEGFDSNKYLPLVFRGQPDSRYYNRFIIADYDKKSPYYSWDSGTNYITINSSGIVNIEVNYTDENYPLIVIFLPAKKI